MRLAPLITGLTGIASALALDNFAKSPLRAVALLGHAGQTKWLKKLEVAAPPSSTMPVPLKTEISRD
jgi:hypothetical protein